MNYHKMSIIDMLTGNCWTWVALAFIAIVTIVALCQYGTKKGRLVKKYGDAPYFLLSVAATLTMSVLLFVESHAGIIQLLDNALRGNESPLLSGLLLGPTAMALAGAFGFGLAVLSEIITTLRKRSLTKKLRHLAEQRRKAQAKRCQPRRGQPHGTPRPGTAHPTRYNKGRDEANHRNHSNRVSSGYGMRRC